MPCCAAYVFDLQEPKATPTPTATLPPAVGGIALDSDLRRLPLETDSPGSSPRIVIAATIAGAAAVALGSAAWYARRRWLT